MIMETTDKDIMRELFAGMTDEPLPFDFNEKVMARIQFEALSREKRNKRLEIFAYISGTVAMIVVCVVLLYNMGVSFVLPEINWSAWTFPKPDISTPKLDYSLFTSESFKFSVYIGMLCLILIIIDSLIRRHIGKTGDK